MVNFTNIYLYFSHKDKSVTYFFLTIFQDYDLTNFCMQRFLYKTISNKMFYPNYKHITDKLLISIKDRVYQ